MGDRKVVIKNTGMSEDMQQNAVECAAEAMDKFSMEKDIAAFIKKEFNHKYNPTWHCIVGRNYGRDSMEKASAENSTPGIRILQRPSAGSTNESKPDTTKATNKTKTYEEREAEYAQARLRILGAAYPEEEDEETPDSNGITTSADGSKIPQLNSKKSESDLISKASSIPSLKKSSSVPEVAKTS